MIGRTGNDSMFGGLGIDNADGGMGNDLVDGGPGGDSTLYVRSGGADRVFGRQRRLRCHDRPPGGDDAVFGGPGRDRYYTDPGDEVTSAEISGPCFAE